MEFNTYQHKTKETAVYPNQGDALPWLGLAITEEAGEVAGKLKKLIRDEEFTTVSELSPAHKEAFVKELGDLLWYMTQFATELGVDFATVAEKNLEKTQSRYERGTLSGSGDNR